MKNTQKQLKINTYRAEGTSRIYSNYVRVVSNPSEVTFQFVDIKPGANDELHAEIIERGEIKAPIDIEIVVSPEIAKAFLNVLQNQLSKLKVNNK